ncbi:MAG: EAL domain-containing protein, partial [Raoultibacter sp.]
SDLLINTCPVGVTKRLDIALDSTWSTVFTLPEDASAADYYYRPLEAAAEYPSASIGDLGYWGSPIDLGSKGNSSITYSLPLRDSTGALCGIFGVEVSTKTLAGYFPYNELDSEEKGSYLLTSIESDTGPLLEEDGTMDTDTEREFSILASTGAVQSLYVQDGKLATNYDAQTRLGAGGDGSGLERAIVSATPLKLYNTSSPYADQQWVLMGLVPQNALFEASQSLERSLLVSLLAAFVIGIILALAIARFSTSRIGQLMNEVRTAKPEKGIRFTATGVREIDELADSIGALGADVASAGARLSKVMELADHAVGAFEYSKRTKTISYTDTFFDTLGAQDFPYKPKGIPSERIALMTLSPSDFTRLMEAFEPFSEKDGNSNIISLPHRSRVVRFVVTEDEASERVMGLVEDVTREMQIRRRIEHERDHDILTGLLNRRAFEQAVADMIEEFPHRFGVMIMLDLDNLKFMNDTYGHDWGDHYIKQAAAAVAGACRRSDICSRISGDEFLLFSQSYSDELDAVVLFDDLQRRLEESTLEAPDGSLYKVRASSGAAFYPGDAQDYTRLRERADFAMYVAKNTRKGELCLFEQSQYDQQSSLLSKREDLNRLLDEILVEYHFQPIVDAHTGDLFAYEALMRPQIASLSAPSLVIDLARMQSKLYKVERMTFFESLKSFSSYDVPETVRLFINSIGTQRLSAEDEKELTRRYDYLLSRLVIEITEGDYGQDLFRYKEDLAQRWAACLAIDDFGSGYNGDATLLDLDARYIKIDMAIIRGIDTDVDRQDLLSALLGYARDRAIKVIAEGVETEEELAMTIKLGVDYIQGFATGKPAIEPRPIDPEVRKLIRSIAQREGCLPE